jgi:hypothetical protein
MRTFLIVVASIVGCLLLVAVGLVGLVFWVAAGLPDAPPKKNVGPVLVENALAVLDYKDPVDIPVAEMWTDSKAMSDALYSGDHDEIERLVKLGRIMYRERGSRVRVRNVDKLVTRVEFVDTGNPKDNGETGYVLTAFVRQIRPDEPRTFTAP